MDGRADGCNFGAGSDRLCAGEEPSATTLKNLLLSNSLISPGILRVTGEGILHDGRAEIAGLAAVHSYRPRQRKDCTEGIDPWTSLENRNPLPG